jgi:endonuclease-3 related protein
MSDQLVLIYQRLLSAFGPQNWWPADTPFEVCVGAILTQNTSWRNVARAVSRLKQASALDAESIHSMPIHELASLIRPAGYYNIKAGRLKEFVSFLMSEFAGSVENTVSVDTGELRAKLLEVKGIGPETADSILLYAFNRPVFVIDAYTMRALYRHDIIDADAGYHDVQELFASALPPDAALYNEYHALWVALGKEYCKKRNPACEACPLGGI